MTMQNIDSALIQAYLDLNLGLDTGYENISYDPPDDGSDWAYVFIVPAVIDYASLGDNGEDEHLGFMQIDFSTPNGTGRGALIGYAQAVRDYFIGGRGFTYNGQNVRIETVDRSPITQIDGWARISVTVNWNATTIRPTT